MFKDLTEFTAPRSRGNCEFLSHRFKKFPLFKKLRPCLNGFSERNYEVNPRKFMLLSLVPAPLAVAHCFTQAALPDLSASPLTAPARGQELIAYPRECFTPVVILDDIKAVTE